MLAALRSQHKIAQPILLRSSKGQRCWYVGETAQLSKQVYWNSIPSKLNWTLGERKIKGSGSQVWKGQVWRGQRSCKLVISSMSRRALKYQRQNGLTAKKAIGTLCKRLPNRNKFQGLPSCMSIFRHWLLRCQTLWIKLRKLPRLRTKVSWAKWL